MNLRDMEARYTQRRNEILANIREGKVSASMSGIEYYPKEWGDYDLSIPEDRYALFPLLTWSDEKRDHVGKLEWTDR